MFQLLAAMTTVVAAWLFLTVMLVGLGLLGRRLLGFVTTGFEMILWLFWLGWGMLILVLQIWHLFQRVNGLVFLLLIVAAAVGIAWNIRQVLAWRSELLSSWPPKRVLLLLGVIVCAALVVANFAIGPPRVYDTGLYHMTAVRWAASYPVVPGLGNLHGRLAFNNSSFLYMALLDGGPWHRLSHHVGNGLLILAVLVHILVSVFRVLRTSDKHWVRHVVLSLLLVPMVAVAGEQASSSSPDLPVWALGIVITTLLLTLVAETSSDSAKDHRFLVFLICFLSIIGVSVKLSFLAVGFASSIVALVLWFGEATARRTSSQLRWLAATIPLSVALVLIPWMVRGVLLSGYVAFPATVGSVAADWRIPRTKADSTRKIVYAWARAPRQPPEEVLADWSWLGPWSARLLESHARIGVQIPAVLILVALMIWVAGLFVPTERERSRSSYWLCLLPPCVGLVFWFFTVPDVRFAGANLWILGGLSLALAVDRLRGTGSAFRVATGVLAMVVAVSVPYAARQGLKLRNGSGGAIGFHPTPKANLKRFVSESGLVVYVVDDEWAQDRSWDAPLPCTPHANSKLRLLCEGDLSRGFAVGGRNPK
ncbi:LIC_10190 family membrane protein [Planctomycetota bacterium]